MDVIGRNYVKEIKDGKEVYSLLNNAGKPGREVETIDWEIRSYIQYCLFPIFNFIKQMGQQIDQDDRMELSEYADILDRLYDAATLQLNKMNDIVNKGVGSILIRTTQEDCCSKIFWKRLLKKSRSISKAKEAYNAGS